MAAAEDLARIGAPPRVRSALATLPPAFADAFAAEAVRLVEGGRVPVCPASADADALPPAAAPEQARAVLLMATPAAPPGVAPLALARWRIVAALLRFDAGRLLAACNAFRLFVLPAWEAAHGRRLAPAGGDWPALPSRDFVEAEAEA